MDRVLRKIQEWRYGNLGLALAAGGTIFTLTSTILQVTGIPGSILILFLDLYFSTVLSFSVYIYLVNRQHKIEQRLERKINQAGRSLNIQRSRIIGVIAPISYWSTEYYVNIVKSVRAAAEREQHNIRRKVIILDVPNEEFSEVEAILSDILVKDVSGLIAINMKINQEVKLEFLKANIPIVSIAHEDNKPPNVCSIVHDPGGFENLLKHVLIEMGSTSAVLITKGLENPFKGVKIDPYRKEKRDLYSQIAAKAGLLVQSPINLNKLINKLDISPGQALIVEVDQYLLQYSLLLFEKLPSSVPTNTAFIFLADIAAIGFLLACQSKGLSAMERGFRVTGFDNTKMAEWFDLTSVDSQLDVVGRLAYEKLQLALDHPDQFSYNQERVKSLSVIRGSSSWE